MITAQEWLAGDIPRACTGWADWVVCMLVLLHEPCRFSGWRMRLYKAAWFLLLPFYLTVTRGYNGFLFNLFYAGSVLLMYLIIRLGTTLSPADTVCVGARAFLLASFLSASMWQIYVYMASLYPWMVNAVVFVIFMVLWYAGIVLVFHIWEGRIPKPEGGMAADWKRAVYFSIIALVVHVLSSISYTSLRTPFGGSTPTEIYNIRTFILLGGTLLLWALHIQQAQFQTVRELDALETVLQLQYESYKVSKEAMELVNRKYHDLKHQIALLRTQNQEQRSELLDQIEQDIKIYEATCQTGNGVLDTIITQKTLECQQKGIQLTCVVDGAALDFISTIDLTTIFGNALENAIDSTAQISAPEKRMIHLAVHRHRGFIRIRVENPYEGEIRFEGAFPLSTKGDDRFHGYGVRSICRAAEKYGGTAAVDAKDGQFALQILIPIPG